MTLMTSAMPTMPTVPISLRLYYQHFPLIFVIRVIDGLVPLRLVAD
jgi:hypothetical protein